MQQLTSSQRDRFPRTGVDYWILPQRKILIRPFPYYMDFSMRSEKRQRMIVPIHAEGCGNAFLLFDYLFHDKPYCLKFVRSCHQYVGYDRIDSCIVLVMDEIVDSTLYLRIRISEEHLDEDMDGFCGNGARAASSYLYQRYGNQFSAFIIRVGTQLHRLTQVSDMYYVEMGPSAFEDPKKQFVACALGPSSTYRIEGYTFYFAFPSEPHLVTFDEMSDEKLQELGHFVQLHCRKDFPGGINLNRVSVLNESSIRNVTFERGVCRITKACGTGSVSAAMVSRRQKRVSDKAEEIHVQVPGGDLIVQFKNGIATLGGPVTVFADFLH